MCQESDLNLRSVKSLFFPLSVSGSEHQCYKEDKVIFPVLTAVIKGCLQSTKASDLNYTPLFCRQRFCPSAYLPVVCLYLFFCVYVRLWASIFLMFWTDKEIGPQRRKRRSAKSLTETETFRATQKPPHTQSEDPLDERVIVVAQPQILTALSSWQLKHTHMHTHPRAYKILVEQNASCLQTGNQTHLNTPWYS